MNIHKIRTEAEYRAALKEASALVDSDPALETPEGKRLNTLVGIVQAYEATYVPVDGALVDRIRSIVAGVEVDLDKPLPPELGRAVGPPRRVAGLIEQTRPLAGIHDPSWRIEDGVAELVPEGAQYQLLAGVHANR